MFKHFFLDWSFDRKKFTTSWLQSYSLLIFSKMQLGPFLLSKPNPLVEMKFSMLEQLMCKKLEEIMNPELFLSFLSLHIVHLQILSAWYCSTEANAFIISCTIKWNYFLQVFNDFAVFSLLCIKVCLLSLFQMVIFSSVSGYREDDLKFVHYFKDFNFQKPFEQ